MLQGFEQAELEVVSDNKAALRCTRNSALFPTACFPTI